MNTQTITSRLEEIATEMELAIAANDGDLYASLVVEKGELESALFYDDDYYSL